MGLDESFASACEIFGWYYKLPTSTLLFCRGMVVSLNFQKCSGYAEEKTSLWSSFSIINMLWINIVHINKGIKVS